MLQNDLFTEAEEDIPIEDGAPEIEDVPEENMAEEPIEDLPPDDLDTTEPDMDTSEDMTSDDFDPDTESISSDMPDGTSVPFDKKISDTLNRNLYQHYISLKKTINQELTMTEDNLDFIDPEVLKDTNLVEILKKLSSNMDLYLMNNFLNNDYSKNVFFYNKCLNMVNLVNIEFSKALKKSQ